jgi:ribonuclease D
MHDHSNNVYYAISDVLLLHRAADVLEIIRQGWGPQVKDIARHLLLHGMAFWMAIVCYNDKRPSVHKSV